MQVSITAVVMKGFNSNVLLRKAAGAEHDLVANVTLLLRAKSDAADQLAQLVRSHSGLARSAGGSKAAHKDTQVWFQRSQLHTMPHV
jgi:hypothetical protein